MRTPASRGLSAAITTVLSIALLAGPASASSTTTTDFYTPPSPLPSGNDGDVIRHEPMRFYLDPLRLIEAPATARRIMYLSRDTYGNRVAVTGTVLTPLKQWHGYGQRPVVAYASGTQGVGDNCAPSRLLSQGNDYEGPLISGLLLRGYGVVVTDYEGLGTPGMHTYVNRVSEAHAVLDSLRAAQRLPGSGLPTDGPLGIVGYSQGGGAAAAAAELAAGYAPELRLKGIAAGAPPADLAEVARFLDGSYAVAFVGYALLSLDYAYPELRIRDLLNAKGLRMAAELEHQCTIEAIVAHAFTRSQTLTRDGRPLEAYLNVEPYATRVEQQRIGTIKPRVPVLVTHSVLDDNVPFEQGRQMARSWCAKGANVRFSTYLTPGHTPTAVAVQPEVFAWLEARFAGWPAWGNCGWF